MFVDVKTSIKAKQVREEKVFIIKHNYNQLFDKFRKYILFQLTENIEPK